MTNSEEGDEVRTIQSTRFWRSTESASRRFLEKTGALSQLKKRVVERSLAGELTHHLGYAKGEAP